MLVGEPKPAGNIYGCVFYIETPSIIGVGHITPDNGPAVMSELAWNGTYWDFLSDDSGYLSGEQAAIVLAGR